jgi:DNA-binding CsgD family transcriptional regulator
LWAKRILPVEGKLCKRIKVENGSLTSREIEIIKLIGQDKMDKEIADILDISLNTAHHAPSEYYP